LTYDLTVAIVVNFSRPKREQTETNATETKKQRRRRDERGERESEGCALVEVVLIRRQSNTFHITFVVLF
jgi:hypothetical protein